MPWFANYAPSFCDGHMRRDCLVPESHNSFCHAARQLGKFGLGSSMFTSQKAADMLMITAIHSKSCVYPQGDHLNFMSIVNKQVGLPCVKHLQNPLRPFVDTPCFGSHVQGRASETERKIASAGCFQFGKLSCAHDLQGLCSADVICY